MRINEYKSELLGETVYTAKHSSGLEIRVLPKENCDSAYALFAVNYGSIDTSVQQEDGSFRSIPEGTAHFLEHKLFESEELDAFELFQRTGASANAYTTFDRTAYLFKGSERIEESLGYLLDFVQNPYFTAETVQKEQGIIGQEIRMYQDMPEWEAMFMLFRLIFPGHPVSIDIAGTQESIAKIDDKLLYELYETFYNPSNMCIAIAGNVDPEKIFKQIGSAIIRKKKTVPQRKFDPKILKSKEKYAEKHLAVARKQFMFGLRDELKVPVLSLTEEFASNIMLEAVFGRNTPFFKSLLDEGLTTMDFSFSFFSGYGYGAYLFSGPSEEPEKLADRIKKEFDRVKKNGIDAADFERVRRSLYGDLVRGYDDIDDIASLLVGLYFTGNKPFDEIKAIRKVTLADVNNRLKAIKTKDAALSVVLPLE